MARSLYLLVICYRSNPDYYEVVKEPIDFTMIQKNVKSAKYQTMEQFVHDVNLMVENEKLYHRVSFKNHLFKGIYCHGSIWFFLEIQPRTQRCLRVLEFVFVSEKRS